MKTSGDIVSFDQNWKERTEANYIHWTRGKPKNQIQLAFSQHWDLFKTLISKTSLKKKRCLEVGCGRGSISAYFSDSGFDCTLLDLSPSVIEKAKAIFEFHDLKANFVVGDAQKLPFEDNSFDVVVSIGLLEHFDDFASVIEEQVRVLDSGGIFLGYVVPENKLNIQKDYVWVNSLIRALIPQQSSSIDHKAPVYRSDAGSEKYLNTMRQLPLSNIQSAGVYPLPMISNSPEFPFTLLNDDAEAVLVEHFTSILQKRSEESHLHPWLCDESYGQAFLLWGYKI